MTARVVLVLLRKSVSLSRLMRALARYTSSLSWSTRRSRSRSESPRGPLSRGGGGAGRGLGGAGLGGVGLGDVAVRRGRGLSRGHGLGDSRTGGAGGRTAQQSPYGCTHGKERPVTADANAISCRHE